MITRNYFQKKNRNSHTSIRHYHVYGIASKFLTIYRDDLLKMKHFFRIQSGSMAQKQITISNFIKKTKGSPYLKHLDEVEKSLDACLNIKKLCDEAYELGRRVREENMEKLDLEVSESLYDFICLTNEQYPCYQKDDYEKIKKMLS